MDSVRRNAYYTFQYNLSFGRHGWLRLTPAYSVRMVEKILSELEYRPECVLEPFSGTGTTELVCANAGIATVAYDVNPFLVWLARVKNAVYTDDVITLFHYTVCEITQKIASFPPAPPPPMFHIERWWNKKQLDYLSRLKSAIWGVNHPQVSDLLKIAFCRQIIELSNAAFNHVSTSFRDGKDALEFSDQDGNFIFCSFCDMIMDTVRRQPRVLSSIQKQDSMFIPAEIEGKYDTIITSPPYPNRISYIRELRPYMYWLDYICTPEDASQLDWETIGGTWGSATSRLSTWKKQTDFLPESLLETADRISRADHKSAGLMANYVLKYFDDMALHMQSAFRTIREGGTVHYIVGNSSFYGNIVPSDNIYQYMLAKAGFHHEKSVVVRKRNCNKALYEYWISAQK